MIGTIDDCELELVPSEKNAESEEVTIVFGWYRVITIDDFDEDECELLGRRRGILLLSGSEEKLEVDDVS